MTRQWFRAGTCGARPAIAGGGISLSCFATPQLCRSTSFRMTIAHRKCHFSSSGRLAPEAATPAAAPMKGSQVESRTEPIPSSPSGFPAPSTLASVRTAIPCPPRACCKCHVERSGSTNAKQHAPARRRTNEKPRNRYGSGVSRSCRSAYRRTLTMALRTLPSPTMGACPSSGKKTEN